MKYFQILIFFLLGISVAHAENNTIIVGKINNLMDEKTIELRVDELYINGKVASYLTNIKEDNTFAFALEIKAPQLIKMAYSKNTTDVYIEPFDTLYVEIDAHVFPYDVGFGGTGAFNNNLWVKYMKKFPKNQNEFEYLQYKSGIYWYHVPPDINDMMLRMSKESFSESMAARQHKRMDFVRAYDKENKDGLTDMFKEFMEAQINYEYGYYMLCYGNVFKNKHGITDDFFIPILELPLTESQIGNFYYREYLKGYINHRYIGIFGIDPTNMYTGQYDLSEIELDDLSLSYFQSELISKAMYRKKIDVILEKYYQFLDTNPYFEFNDKVTNAYHKVMKYHEGSPAPDFSLTTIEGNEITLASLKGKPVFLNFWATWCKPCVKKMDKLKVYQEELEKKGIVLLNVSFDRKEDVWKSSIKDNDYGGIHVFLPEANDTEIARDYNVKAIPQFYLIDKAGNFAEGPSKGSDILELKEKLELLLK